MASRLKEEEKNERTIRSLLKLPENRRCINCNSLGPQYVCTNFWTFICINCSGIHREFTHRVKSVSMAKFTSQEVTALQEGGNKLAKEIYLKDWDAQHQSLPDSSNVLRLRDFIKHVYVDKRYSGDKNFDKPPRAKTGDKDDSYENRRSDNFQGGSRSPPYEDAYERRYSDRSSPGGTSPGFDQESRQYRSPSPRPEVVNDWRREDRFGNGRKFEESRSPDGDSKLEGRSPDRKSVETSSPPIVRPVREILGENVVPLRIREPPKANGSRTSDGSVQPQRTVSSSSLGSSDGKPAEVKQETLRSLIDFDIDPEPPRPVATPPVQQATVAQTVSSSTSDNNWASFDSAPQSQAPPPSTNTLDSVLSQLSAPASVPDSRTQAPFGHGHQFPIVGNQQSSLYPGTGNQTTFQQFNRPIDGAPSIQPTNFSFAPSSLGPVSTPAVSGPLVGVSQRQPAEVKLSERQALPADLFTHTYSPYPAMGPGWQTGPPRGTVYPMQYNTAMAMQMQQPIPMFPQPSKSTNPFDLSEPTQTAVQFPSMGSLQGALPNVQHSSGLMRTSSLGTPSQAWTQHQPSPYPSAMQHQPSPYGAPMPPRPYMGQQIPSSASYSGLPGVGNFGSDVRSFGSMNTDQQMPGRFSAPATPQHFPSVGGNPFG